MKKIDIGLILIPIAVLLLIGYLLFFILKGKDKELPPPEYIGRDACYDCHEDEMKLHFNSHHDLAMDVANEKTVLADFNNTFYVYYGDTSWFYMHNGEYRAKTFGEDNKYHEYKIKYTFGWTPLQQYLVEFPGGRYQMLPFAWDTNPKEDGGQKWFHLYPDEPIKPGDELHWTGLNQNWNYMCAECHSTDLDKGYDLATNTYNTTWNEIDVSCEACHGPSSSHVEWARLDEKGRAPFDPKMGLVYLTKEEEVSWIYDTLTGNAARSKVRTDHTQIEMCGRCHSRRFVISDDYEYGKTLLNTHRPDILFDHLYYHDGQIKEEDYVYGSFLQSKMYRKGVTCTDCHDPHSMRPVADGNLVCAKCHMPTKFDTPSHHFHKMDSTGASCLDCHMPETKYMVNDPRRDHSIRIPRPDISLKIGSPNACNQCHKDKTVQWADNAFRKWYGNKYDTIPHYGETFYAAAHGDETVVDDLKQIINDTVHADIVKASAVYYLGHYFQNYESLQELIEQTRAPVDYPLVKTTALMQLSNYNMQDYFSSVVPLLGDSLRTIRMEAARLIATVPPNYYPPNQKTLIEQTVNEYIQSVLVNGDQPGANINLGVLYAAHEQYADAERSYKNAIRIDKNSMAAYINLADLYRMQNREAEGEAILLQALKIDPEFAEIHYSLGLLYAREKQLDKALGYLERATELQPDNARFLYIYAVAINTSGKNTEALAILKHANKLSPNDTEILFALSTISRDMGNKQDAIKFVKRILEINPQNQQAVSLLNSLKVK